jgi:adenine-specific DNA-methyltransferase
MTPITPASPESRSADIVAGNLSQLKALFPEAFTEGSEGKGEINFEVLKQLLGGAVEEREEKYGLNWHGKRKARELALTPSTGTLRPCPEDSVDWDTTQNLMIEGDNLEVLKLLQKSYAGKVKLIYIDPPYNTGKDFVYPDNFQDNIKNYLELTGHIEGGRKIEANPDASGRFHTDWLNMMYPRLKLARNLLKEDGLLFASCDSGELQNMICLVSEIFGEENIVAHLVWKKSYGGGSKTKHVVTLHEYVLCIVRDISILGRLELPPDPKARKYYKLKDSKFEIRGPFRLQPLATTSNDERENLRYAIPYHGEEIWPEKQWQWEKGRALAALENDELVISRQSDGWSANYKQYLCDEDGVERGAKPFSILDGPYTQTGTSEVATILGDPKLFPFPKPTGLIQIFAQYTNPEKDSLVLDFFAGSGTTGHALISQNQVDGGSRRYILVQLPEPLDPGNQDQKTAAEFCKKLGKPLNIAELTKERLRRAGKKIAEENPLFKGDLGFRVFKLDSSNIRSWDPEPANLETALLDSVDHIKQGRSESDILYELLLKLGLDLAVPIEAKKIGGMEVHAIGAGSLFVCLADKVKLDAVEALALGIVAWRKELNPAGEVTCVFRDSGFEDNVAKTNLTAILLQSGIGNVRSI